MARVVPMLLGTEEGSVLLLLLRAASLHQPVAVRSVAGASCAPLCWPGAEWAMLPGGHNHLCRVPTQRPRMPWQTSASLGRHSGLLLRPPCILRWPTR